MKRRDLLKSLSLAAGGAFCATPSWGHAAGKTEEKDNPKLAIPVRALIRKNGELFQPLQMSVENSGTAGMAVTTIDGTEIDRRTLQAGASKFDLYLKPVTGTRRSTVVVALNGQQQTAEIELKPVRQMLIYALPHSHHDLGYTDLQANVEEKQIQNITRGIELARKTADYPEGSRFVWNLEVLWGADLYMRRKSEADKKELMDAVKKGWVAINGSYANQLTGLCRPEELLQLFRYSGQLGRLCDTKVDSAMMSDVPGYSWGTVTAMAQAGIRYFSGAPNFFDRIGTFMVTWQDKPFWWVSPSGKEKVLFWVPWTGYALSHVMKLGADLVSKYQDRMDDVHYPYDISYIRWSGHGDNAEPDAELSDWIRDWNQKYEWPRFSIASTSTAFSAFENRYGNQLPQFRGDLTPYWEDGAGSSALETAMSRNAADRISQATAMAAVSKTNSYDPAAYAEAWRDVLLYSEHTWGAWNSISDSENPFVTKQWDVKRAFAVDADKLSKELLHRSFDEPSNGGDTKEVEIHNSTSWDRTEIVYLPSSLSAGCDHVADSAGHPVPSQRLSSGELAVLASGVPAFGASRYKLSAQKAHVPSRPVSFKSNVLANGIIQAGIDPVSGDIVELKFSGDTHNLVDHSDKHNINQFLFLAGKDVDQLQSSGSAKISIEEHGPLVTTLRIESSAPGCKSLVRRISLAAGMDHFELTNIVDKQQAPLNPHPGNGDQSSEFAQHGSKESIQFAFPFAVPNGKLTMDIPLGNMRPEIDQLPGSCKNWLPVGRWMDVSNEELGVTWVTQDAPLVEIGKVSAIMLGSQKDPSVWRKNIEPTQTFYSWVMNNHWGTNYRAYQEGPVAFRYVIRPHRKHDAAAANRLAIGYSEPLLVGATSSNRPASSILRIEPSDVLALTLKPSEDRKAWIVRLFGASGEARTAKLSWAPSVAGESWISNLAEEQLHPSGNEISVAGWELVTLRVEREG